MHLNTQQSRVISNIPEIDGGNLWICDTLTGAARSVPVSAADRILVCPGYEGFFAVVHHYRDAMVEISVHQMNEEPGVALSRIIIDGLTWRFEGYDEVWGHVPRAFLAFYTPERMSDADDHLILIDAHTRRAEIRKFPPFYGGDNQRGRVKGVSDVPSQATVLVEQKGDERAFLLFNTRRNKVTQHLSLTTKPRAVRVYRFREHASELWVSDPDHLIKMAPNFLGDWVQKGILRLQLMDSTNGRYTGGITFSPDESLGLVARPFLGDVLLIDTAKFEVLKRVQLEGMPRIAALLSGGRLIARNWSDGKPLVSSIQRSLAVA